MASREENRGRYNRILSELKWALQDGKLTEAQYQEAVAAAQAAWEAGTAIKASSEYIKQAKSAKKKREMTKAEFTDLVSNIQQMRDDGDIDRDEMTAMLAEADRLRAGKADRATAEKVINALADGVPAEFAEQHAGFVPAKETTRKMPEKNAGDAAVDSATAEIEKNLKKIYGDAAKELRDRLEKLERDYAGKLEKKREDVRAGRITDEEYTDWVRSQLMQQERVKQQIDQCAGVLTNANKKALGMVNGEQVGVFAENANFQSYQIDRKTGLNLMFSVYDEHTAEKLIKENPNLLPPKKINERKDTAWNHSRLTAAVTQAVIQGDSIPKLARRIAGDAAASNASTMMRYARTAMTAAQNAGRQEMLHQAKGLGIKCKKRWLATLDSRTRDSHRNLDGQTVDVDKPFISDLGKIMFPGDPTANPGDVWNCRCTMTYEYEGYEEPAGADLRRDNETGELIRNMTYNEWKAANAPAAAPAQPSKLQEKVKKAANPVDTLSTETRDALEEYTMGEEFHLDQKQFDEITEAMAETTNPMYRVEAADRTAEQADLQVGDDFDFSQYVFESKDAENGPLRSFTRSEDALPDLLGQTDGAVIFRTHGAVEQLPVDSLSQYDQKESLAYGNGWKVKGFDTIEIDGKKYRVIDIEQIKKEPEQKPAEDYDAIMKKVAAMQDDKETWDDGKKNLLPLAEERLSDQAHRIYCSMTPEEENRLARETILDISKLKTEQKEVFTDRLEDLAEAFNGKEVTGAKTAEHDGITVARWNGEYIVLDGNNRTNLAILKGQEQINVMLLDFDDNPDLQDKIRDVVARTPVDGKNITASWKRRPDDFAFEIEDVMNAQGFDGLPRIADAAEFNAAVKASGFIAQRVYSAPDQETLDLYQDMLYNGKWYVDCGAGGAFHGQGMYCSSNYSGKITDQMKTDMEFYMDENDARLTTAPFHLLEGDEMYGKIPSYVKKIAPGLSNEQQAQLTTWLRFEKLGDADDDPDEAREALARAGIDAGKYGKKLDDYRDRAPAYVETMTLTPDAKIITYEEALKQMGKKDRFDQTGGDMGVWAAKQGYDAIRIDYSNETLILNRTKVIIKGGGKK